MLPSRVVNSLITVLFLGWILLAARAAGAQTVARVEAVRQVASAPARRMPIALRTIVRGTVLTADDFEYRDTTTHIEPDTAQITAGWVTRRTIAAGEILHAPAVEPPTIVNANSPVQVEFVDGNVRLTVRGVAARNGSLGERVPVRTELGKRVEGTVVAPGRVRID
ncbi:MAG TPA: flagellar basal body P-ring formation chaperone FlgA [Gemmatimonadaceae bacterium]